MRCKLPVHLHKISRRRVASTQWNAAVSYACFVSVTSILHLLFYTTSSVKFLYSLLLLIQNSFSPRSSTAFQLVSSPLTSPDKSSCREFCFSFKMMINCAVMFFLPSIQKLVVFSFSSLQGWSVCVNRVSHVNPANVSKNQD